MPIYTYEDEDTGQEVALQRSMAEATPIGETIEYQGRRLRRLVDMPGAVAKKLDGDNGYWKDYQIGRKHPLAKTADAYDERGTPMWKGKSRYRGHVSRCKDAGMDVDLDG